MAPLPRILTVDPSGGAAGIVRAALRLLERPAIQVDVPGGIEAFDEVERGHFRLLISAVQLGDGLSGAELAQRVRQRQPETHIVLLASPQDALAVNSLEQLGQETGAFLVLRHPIEPHQLLRILYAALDGRDIVSAAFTTQPGSDEPLGDMPPVPVLDLSAARRVLDSALTDVGAMAAILSTRTGDVLIERGAVGYLDRERLTDALAPTVSATIDMTRLIGGRPAALLFYDGDNYDVFVLSVGLHHFISLVFDGQNGLRAYGAVNRYGRRAAEDLIALIGANALILDGPAQQMPLPDERSAEPEVEPPLLARAELPPAPIPPRRKTETVAAISAPLEPEPDAASLLSLFSKNNLQALDASSLDDLFNPDKLAEIASETRQDTGPLSYEEARELGLIP
ncbi:MAG: response regulator transcription factor [Anaerolineae bacterium]|nr:response regulator transcription factor [Anaerolineae bacterium]